MICILLRNNSVHARCAEVCTVDSLLHGCFSIYVAYNCPTDSVIGLQLPMNSDLVTSLYTFRSAEDLLTAEYCTGRVAMAVLRHSLTNPSKRVVVLDPWRFELIKCLLFEFFNKNSILITL